MQFKVISAYPYSALKYAAKNCTQYCSFKAHQRIFISLVIVQASNPYTTLVQGLFKFYVLLFLSFAIDVFLKNIYTAHSMLAINIILLMSV